MTKHEWRDTDESGKFVYFRALHHAGKWQFKQREKSSGQWEALPEPDLALLKRFREVLWNKHLRRRAPLKQVESIDELIDPLK